MDSRQRIEIMMKSPNIINNNISSVTSQKMKARWFTPTKDSTNKKIIITKDRAITRSKLATNSMIEGREVFKGEAEASHNLNNQCNTNTYSFQVYSLVVTSKITIPTTMKMILTADTSITKTILPITSKTVAITLKEKVTKAIRMLKKLINFRILYYNPQDPKMTNANFFSKCTLQWEIKPGDWFCTNKTT